MLYGFFKVVLMLTPLREGSVPLPLSMSILSGLWGDKPFTVVMPEAHSLVRISIERVIVLFWRPSCQQYKSSWSANTDDMIAWRYSVLRGSADLLYSLCCCKVVVDRRYWGEWWPINGFPNTNISTTESEDLRNRQNAIFILKAINGSVGRRRNAYWEVNRGIWNRFLFLSPPMFW